MTTSHDQDQDHERLVESLTTGFGALLEQMQELARKNIELERRLARAHREVSSSSPFITLFNLL